MPSIVEILKNDHRLVESLFARLEKAPKGVEREAIFDELSSEFDVHASAEETAVYPRLEKEPELKGLVEHSFEEHNVARELIMQAQRIEPSSEAFLAAIKKLKGAIEHHVREEEEKLFPKMESVLDRNTLEIMAHEVERSKQRFAHAV
jgi:hemerythrin superfamily protein